MNKFIALILLIAAVMPLGIDVAKIHAATDRPVMVTASYKPIDVRARTLKNVLSRHNSPLIHYADSYVAIADKHGVDWKLLPSIAGLESSFGKRQMPGSYNSYGWGGGHIYFSSVEDGIDRVLSGLKKRYIDRGATTVEAIAPIYSESPTWAPRIRFFMNQLDAEMNRLALEELELTI